jgi:hypothetical protein
LQNSDVKENEMTRFDRRLAIMLLAIMLAGCANGPDVEPETGACYLKAAIGDVYLKVFELDNDGNMGPLIWQGKINQGQTERIQTAHARLRYFYNSQPDVEQPFRGGVDKACDDLEIVGVP